MPTPPPVEARRRAVDARQVFQWMSYAQYPCLLVTLGYAVQTAMALIAVKAQGWEPVLDGANLMLLFGGVAIGLSSLQDPTQTQNEFSRRVWQNPTQGRWALMVLAAYALVPIAAGLVGAALAKNSAVSQLALGLVAFGLGMMGLLKTAMEMREHHRLDRLDSPHCQAPSASAPHGRLPQPPT